MSWLHLSAIAVILPVSCWSAEISVSVITRQDFIAQHGESVNPRWESVRLIQLTGLVRTGDALRFQHALRGNEEENGWYGNHTLFSLDSGGGDLQEALRIIGIVKDRAIPTYIGPKAICLSACAFIFMAGTQSWDVGNRFFGRFLDIEGRLGFHAPYLSSGVGRFEQGVEAIAGIFQALGQLDGDLYHSMLTTPPGDFVHADTVSKVGAWKIQLSGYATPSITPASLESACFNIYRWHGGAEPPRTMLEMPYVKPDFEDYAEWHAPAVVSEWEQGLRYQVPYIPYGFPRCDVAAGPTTDDFDHSGTGIAVWYTDDFAEQAWGDDGIDEPSLATGVPPWWMLDSSLRLDELERSENLDTFAFLDSADVYGGIGP